jgi:hypothetical protein
MDYLNIEELPNDIDLKYYGIVETKVRIHYIALVQWSTHQELYKCGFHLEVSSIYIYIYISVRRT